MDSDRSQNVRLSKNLGPQPVVVDGNREIGLNRKLVCYRCFLVVVM